MQHDTLGRLVRVNHSVEALGWFVRPSRDSQPRIYSTRWLTDRPCVEKEGGLAESGRGRVDTERFIALELQARHQRSGVALSSPMLEGRETSCVYVRRLARFCSKASLPTFSVWWAGEKGGEGGSTVCFLCHATKERAIVMADTRFLFHPLVGAGWGHDQVLRCW